MCWDMSINLEMCGKRIKSIRKRRRLTQEDLAGGIAQIVAQRANCTPRQPRYAARVLLPARLLYDVVAPDRQD